MNTMSIYLSDSVKLKKFSLLAVIFFLIIGIYWALRPVKDGVFISMVGADYLPYVKVFSLLVIVPIMLAYGKLIDSFSREKVFYILSIIFAAIALLFFFVLKHPVYGIANPALHPIKITIGVLLCVFVKMFGSMLVALFWSIVSDITQPEEAHNWYSLIYIGGQLGNIVGPLFVGCCAKMFGTANICLLASGLMFLLFPLMYYFKKTIPQAALVGFQGKQKDAPQEHLGMLEGFRYIFATPYLFSIYSTIFIFELIQSIFDFKFKMLASVHYTGDELVAFLGKFGSATGVVSIICLCIISFGLNKKINFQQSLIFLPCILILLVMLNSYSSLAIAMWCIIITRALNYSFNQPAKEQLYIVTSKEAKYKSKAWIEIFGTRTAEGLVETVNVSKGLLGSFFNAFTSSLSLSCIVVWLYLSVFLAKKYTEAVKKDEFIC